MKKIFLLALAVSFSLSSLAQTKPDAKPESPVAAAPAAAEKPAPEAERPAGPPVTTGWGFGLGLSLMSDAMAFSKGTSTIGGTSTDGTAAITLGGSFALQAQLHYLKPYEMGFISVLSLEGERRVTDDNFSFSTPKNDLGNGDNKSARFRMHTLSLEAAYQWRDWFIPVGIFGASSSMTPASGYDGQATLKTGVGFQAGIGLIANSHWMIDGRLRSLPVNLKTVATNGDTIDYGNGAWVSFITSAKYLF